jgi:predicted unusual protein kinase regulating ubiquinone biosynthesis (AarF/ABC1/UbiB family)
MFLVHLFCCALLQVDLSREAANLQRFNQNFKRARAVSNSATV